MQSSTVEGTEVPAARADADAEPAPGWLRRLRSGRRGASSQAQLVEELEVELALLREEHARLKVTRQRARDRPVNERVRELLPQETAGEGAEGEPWELLTDCLLLRNGLIDACHEIEASMRQTRQRLEAIAPSGERDRAHEREREHERPRRDLLGRPTAREDLESAA